MASVSELIRTPSVSLDANCIHPDLAHQDAVPGIEEVSTSWRRCLGEYKVDPGSRVAPNVLTAGELRENREPVEELVSVAREENDRLHAIVGEVGYAVLFTSPEGVVVDFRGDPGRANEYKHWGTCLGGLWSENIEGTNGIGTCIAEQRPVTIHRAQHFRTRHASLSCCGAPIFDPVGELAAVLDVTSIDPNVSDRSHALALAVTTASAYAIEERLFRNSFRRAWILAVAMPAPDCRVAMLAVDNDQRITGADRNARSALGLDDSMLARGVSLWAFFDRSPAPFRPGRDDVAVRLMRIGDRQPWRALITPPDIHSADAPHARAGIGRMGHFFRVAATDRQSELGQVPDALYGPMLSPREQSVLQLIGQGRSNKEIARVLRISPETVKSHVKNMFSKLGVDRRAQAILRAQNLGLLTTG